MVIQPADVKDTDLEKAAPSDAKPAEKQNITLLDVCCGTGTIGLCVAASMPTVKKVVGVELCEKQWMMPSRMQRGTIKGQPIFRLAAEKCEFLLA